MAFRFDPLQNDRGKSLFVDHKAYMPEEECKTPEEIFKDEKAQLMDEMEPGYNRFIQIERSKSFYRNLRYNLAKRDVRRATYLDSKMT